MPIEAFASEWLHCDRLSSYVARAVGHNRADSLLYANLLSSALNEFLETAFAYHGPGGEISCRISRSTAGDVIEVIVPCDGEALAFFSDVEKRLSLPDLAEVYHAALFSSGKTDPHLGFLEMAVDYRATISIIPEQGSRLRVSAQMVIEGASV